MQYPRDLAQKLIGLSLFIAMGCLILSVGLWKQTAQSSLIGQDENKTSSNHASLNTIKSDEATRSQLAKNYARQSLSFEANRGQTNSQVQFISRGSGYALFLTASEAVLDLRNQRSKARDQRPSSLRMKLVGANPESIARGLDELPGKRNYFIGNDPARWQRDVPVYSRVEYDEVYSGVNLVYYGRERQLEYDFLISPHADPNQIKLNFDGARNVRIDESGDLILQTANGEIRQRKPVVYQGADGTRREIAGHYVLRSTQNSELKTQNSYTVGFQIGDYDRSLPLVIDPVLVYSTYLGGTSDDFGSSIAVDSSGNVYVAGVTNSINFPTKTPYQSSNGGTSDIFITKLDSTGTNVIYSTYIGGNLNDRGDGIAVDSSGNAYVVGRTDSLNFPTTQGALASTYRGGDFDAVVLKLNPQGNNLVYSTYLGGSDNDSAIGIAVDASGNAYVTGGTKSSDFPTTASAYLSSHTSDTDAYLTKLNPSGSAILYSSYLGGSATDRGSGVAVDSSGNAYVVGYTSSADFATQNPFQSSLAGSFDAFVAKFNTTSSGSASLIYCSYLGGANDDKGYGIALDTSGDAYVTGQTASNNFPVASALQQTFGGVFDAFIAKISPAGAKLYATYLGGSNDDRGISIAVNTSNNVYVTGFTSSTNFPTANPLQASNGGGSDAFIAKLNSSGSALIYSTYLGGSGNENLSGNVTWSASLALDAASNAYITGFTSSSNFPSANPFQGVNGGGIDAFVAKIIDTSSAPDYALSASPSTQTVAPGSSVNYITAVTPSGSFTGNVSLSASGLPTGASASFSPTPVNITDASAKNSTITVTTSASTPVGTYPLTITSTSGNLQHTTTITLRVVSAGSADISIAQTASPNPADIGTSISYRIIVTNNGPASATSVNVIDNLPASVTSVSSSATQGSCSGTGPVICSLGAIPNGANAIVTINAIPNVQGQVTNTANVTANEPDPDTANNSSSVNTLVEAPAVPVVLDQNLSVKTILSGLDQPTSMAFIGPNEFFVLEKATGKVQHVFNGQLQTVAVDLAVNNASERGLLGLALHPNFPATPYVYLYWTESSTGADTSNLDEVPLLGNRVDRFTWNGSTLTLDRNIIKLRALQQDAGQPSRGNHNGGVVRFGPDGKLYIVIGDNGRRGFLQNVTNGSVPDDQFGGPEPDDAHLTGVILRLNDDGTTPTDNPFYNATTNLTGQAAANIKKVFAYGIRNSFGVAFDPATGNLWTEENGDDAFDEINRVVPGFNGGWIQIIGPSSRISDYKSIESTYGAGNLQQIRWSPTLIADTPAQALSRLYTLPGSQYREPEFSWKYAVAPSTIGFVKGGGLGSQFDGDLFVGASRTTLYNGYLFHFKFSNDRLSLATTDPRLQDKVADNLDKFDITESETLLIGKNFGITTDIETGPDGNLYVVSLSNGAIYQIFANNTVQLSSSTYSVSEAAGSLAVNVTRTGNTADAISVDYGTSDTAGLTPCNQTSTGIASSRCDYVTTVGTLRFGAGETTKTIFIPIVNDSYAEGSETFTLTLSNPNGATLGSVSNATVTINDNDVTTGGNPIVDPQFFIRQQYIDFLGREPDPPGFAGWLNILNNCPQSGKDAQGNFCDRIEVSADFFRSPEFQDRGYFIYRFYSVGMGRTPLYREFTPDFAKVSGFLSDAQLEANKVAFVREFMARAEFRNRYDALTDPAAYVNALVSTAGVTPANKQQLIDDLAAGRKTRAEVLRAIVESTEVYQKFYNEAFVVMQYFGYLRRDPDILYLNWIQTMNQNGGDYRVMINGFMNSSEYFLRFGP
ncbi:MAG: hypothetical protein DMF68_08300 [Acidobacteria bacterium]|nr:MAG: hypothetical protein DMF68_08300 [Acidobacteriota bacterium]